MALPEGKIKDEMSIWILLKWKLSTLYALFITVTPFSTLSMSYNRAPDPSGFEILRTMTPLYPQACKRLGQSRVLVWLRDSCKPGGHETSITLLLARPFKQWVMILTWC